MKHLLAVLLLVLLPATAPASPLPGAAPGPPAAGEEADPRLQQVQEFRDRHIAIKKQQADGTPIEADARQLLSEIDAYDIEWPGDPRALRIGVSLCKMINDLQCADQKYLRILTLNPDMVLEGLNWAAMYHETDPDRTESILRQLMAAAPEKRIYPMSLYEYIARRDMGRIVPIFETHLEQQDTFQLLQLIEGVSSVDRNAGLAFARRYAEQSPGDIEATVTLVNRLRWTGRFKEALVILESLDSELMVRDDIGILYSDCLFGDNEFLPAMEHLELMEGDPESEGTQGAKDRKWRLLSRPRMIGYWKTELEIRGEESERDDNPRIRMLINGNPVIIELYETQAPIAVANFIALSRSGFYDQTPFHRVHPTFLSQGGAPGDAPPTFGAPGYSIENEAREGANGDLPLNARRHFAGSLAMALIGPGQEVGSQFYITHSPTNHLDGQGPVIGHVVEGLDVVRTMRGDEVLEQVEVLRARDHAYDPDVVLDDGTAMKWSQWRARTSAPATDPGADPDQDRKSSDP